MTNSTLFKTMITKYNDKAYTHHYIFGFAYKGNIYKASATAEILPYVLKLDQASRGAGYSVRFCPTVAQKLILLEGAKVVCSVKFFEETVKNSIYNKGEIFEKFITEESGQSWKKDNVSFTLDGDVTINKVAYQVKFEKATFCTEKSLANLF